MLHKREMLNCWVCSVFGKYDAASTNLDNTRDEIFCNFWPPFWWKESLLAVTRRNEYFPDTMQTWTLFSFANPIPRIILTLLTTTINWRILAHILMKERATECRWNHGFHSEVHISVGWCRKSSSSSKMNSRKPGTLWMKGHKSLQTLCDSYLKIACGKFLYVRHICIVVLNKRHPCAISGFAFKYEKKDVCRTR